MLIVIDGYNLFKNVLKVDFISDNQRAEILHKLARYARIKRHQLVIVFDAGPFVYPSREKNDDMEIIFSGKHMSADDYIINYLDEHVARDPLLVSTDKQIRSAASRLRLDSITSWDFYQYVMAVFIDYQQPKLQQNSPVHIYSSYDDGLDEIMHKAAEKIMLKKEDEVQEVTLSGKVIKNKKLVQKLKKL